jgi:hypothetical protein
MPYKVDAHRIFLTFLTDSVQHMLNLHRMMEAQCFLRYRSAVSWELDVMMATG